MHIYVSIYIYIRIIYINGSWHKDTAPTSAKEPYNLCLLCGKRPANEGILCIFAILSGKIPPQLPVCTYININTMYVYIYTHDMYVYIYIRIIYVNKDTAPTSCMYVYKYTYDVRIYIYKRYVRIYIYIRILYVNKDTALTSCPSYPSPYLPKNNTFSVIHVCVYMCI